jgi:hypothetical protein
MADIGQALAAALETATGIYGCIYPQIIPQDASLPAIAYQQIGGNRLYSQSGDSGLPRSLFQITVQATTYSAAKTLTKAIRQALSGYRGSLGGMLTVGGIFVSPDYDGWNETTQAQVVRLDATIYHNE